MQRKKNKKMGFTLVELVVVVAIIGVLAAIAVPRVRTALARSKDAAAVANIETLRKASNVYFSEIGESAGATIEETISKLKEAGYLDSKFTNTDGIFDVGNTTCTGTTPDLNSGKIQVDLEEDKVGIKIAKAFNGNGGAVLSADAKDTNCELWPVDEYKLPENEVTPPTP